MEIVSRVIGPLATNVHLVADERSREVIAIDAAIPGLAWITGQLRVRGWILRLIVSTHGHWDHAGENAALQAWSAEQLVHLAGHAGLPAAGSSPPGDAETGRPSAGGGKAAGAVAPGAGDAGAGDPSRPSARATEIQVGGGPPGEAPIAAHPADWYRLVDPQPLFAPFPIPACVPAVELAEGGIIRFGEVRLDVLHTPGHTEGSVCLLAPDAGTLFSGDTLFAGSWGRTDLPGGSAEAMAESLARLALLDESLGVLPGHGQATTIRRERPWLDLVVRQGRLPI